VNLSDILGSINHSKTDLSREGLDKEYVPYVINRCLSYFPDTLFHANRVNSKSNLTKIQQYQYYLNSVSPRKRFSRWIKQEKSDDIELIMEYYGYSRRHAQSVLTILNSKELDKMKDLLKKGGPKNQKS